MHYAGNGVGGLRLWLCWSARDLRARWLVIAAIALLIAVGTGFYASLKSLLPWQIGSYAANFAALHTQDLEVSLAPGVFVSRGTLVRIARTSPIASELAAAQERVIVTTQVEVSAGGRSVLVPGRLVGAVPGQQAVDTIATRSGRALSAADGKLPVAQLEYSFASHWHLPDHGDLRIAGGATLRYVGLAQAPEDFVVVSSDGLVDASASFAIVYAPLAIAARLGGHAGSVNDLVLRARSHASAGTLSRQLEHAFATRLRFAGATVSGRAAMPASRVLYADARGEQRMYNVFALLLLGAAAFAAFNLIARIVEAQRREIGIGLALGAGWLQLAIRPLLMAAEVALLGVALGIGVGLALNAVLRGILATLAPLPSYHTPFEMGIFIQAAAIGFVLPFAASVYPVLRGVRRRPIEAIRIGANAARGAGLAPLLRRLVLPGRTLAQMPARELLRRPARTALTVLSIGVVITILIAILGILDSVSATSTAGRRAMVGSSPTLTIATLDGLYPRTGARLRAIASLPAVGASAPSLRLSGTLWHGHRDVPAVIELVASNTSVWRPTVRAGRALSHGAGGILISAKASTDLGVGVGGTVLVAYLRPLNGGGLVPARASFRVLGIDSNPIRAFAYLDSGRGSTLGYGNLVNTLTSRAAPGASQATLERSLFVAPGVASVEPASAVPDVSRDRLNDFVGIVRVVEVILLGLALLIAFNASSISAEETTRERATMFAFGLPIRSVLGVAVAQSMLAGALGTLVAIIPGYALLHWIIASYLEPTYPDLGIIVSISPASVATIVLVGVAAVALAPLLTVRRLRRMNIPAALRTVE
jgi:putative ABC transport system permease protein